MSNQEAKNLSLLRFFIIRCVQLGLYKEGEIIKLVEEKIKPKDFLEILAYSSLVVELKNANVIYIRRDGIMRVRRRIYIRLMQSQERINRKRELDD